MKTLVLVRHAKSSWLHPELDDFDRPLNDRGKRDAPEMAQRLLKRNLNIDLFVSSSARRARKTAFLFAEAFGLGKSEVQLLPELYHASPEKMLEAIRKFPDDRSAAVVFGHNPGITALSNQLSHVKVDHFPTCAVYAVRINVTSWAALPLFDNEFLFFDYPRAVNLSD